MSSQHPHDISPIASSSKVEISVLTETKVKSTDHKETSRDEFQSFVIVNDIDVEEEMTKAQKDENRNFFKMLSMSFYGRVKSHSLDTQETRETNKYNMTPQAGRKPAFPRKASAHTPPDSKREALKGLKQKTQGSIKKTAPLIKDLPLTPEQFRRHLLTPKDTSIKMYSPVVVGKNCPGTMTSKDETKREVAAGFFREVQQRPQTVKAGNNRRADSGKKSGSSEKMQLLGKDDVSQVKTNVFKLSRYPQKVNVGEQTEEKVQLTSVEPSGLDLKVEGEKENGRDMSSDNLLKDVKLVRKQTSRRENNKPGQEKSTSTNNSGRSLPSSGQKKEATEVKRFVLDPDSRPGTASGYAKYSKNMEGKSRKNAKQKASSQESKHSCEDKFKRLEIMEDSDTEEKRYRRDRDVYTRQNTTSTGKDNRQCSMRLDRQRSPIPAKMQERIPTAYNGGIGSWGKAMLIPSNDVTPKQEKQEKNEKRKESGSLEGKKSSSQSKEPKKTGKVKADSTEKLGKMELQWPVKTGEWLEQERNAFTPKYDMLRQKGKEKTWTLFEMYGKPKEKKEKERPSSPGIEENHKHFDLLELLSQKRAEKI